VHETETTLQFAVPLSGLALVLADDDLLWLHVAGHITFFVALGAHLTLVLGKGMLPGGSG
jgi:hypothetical protein